MKTTNRKHLLAIVSFLTIAVAVLAWLNQDPPAAPVNAAPPQRAPLVVRPDPRGSDPTDSPYYALTKAKTSMNPSKPLLAPCCIHPEKVYKPAAPANASYDTAAFISDFSSLTGGLGLKPEQRMRADIAWVGEKERPYEASLEYLEDRGAQTYEHVCKFAFNGLDWVLEDYEITQVGDAPAENGERLTSGDPRWQEMQQKFLPTL